MVIATKFLWTSSPAIPTEAVQDERPSQEYVIVETRTDRYDPLVSRTSLTGVVAAGLVTPK